MQPDKFLATAPMVGEWNQEFYTMEELEKWFDSRYCGFERVVVVAPQPSTPEARRDYPLPKLNAIAEAASPRQTRKVEWLRRDGNEEWYGPRLAIAQAVWNELKARHELVVKQRDEKFRELERKFNKQGEEVLQLRERCNEAEYGLREIKGHMGIVRRQVEAAVQSLSKFKSLRTITANFRELLKFQLKQEN